MRTSAMNPATTEMPRDSAAATARTILIGRALHAFADGYVAVLLPAYLLAVGMLSAPLVLCGSLKIAYDLAPFVAFRRHLGHKA